MDFLKESFARLYPGKEFNYVGKVRYSMKFKNFNANIRLRGNMLVLSLSHSWKEVGDEIKIGLAQNLMLRLLGGKKHTMNIDLYNNFIKRLPNYIEKNNIDPVLESAFDNVNREYLFNGVEKPNLAWGNATTRRLACYEYATDTITVSSFFRNAGKEIMEYLIYHEMLHKKMQFYNKNGRAFYHTKEFRDAENKFRNKDLIEKEIERMIKASRRSKAGVFGWF